MTDLSRMNISERFQWAADNLVPKPTDYVIVFDDPMKPEEPTKIVVPTPEWMACAIHGGILSSIEHHHNMKLELLTDQNEIIETTFLGAQEICLQKNIVGERLSDHDEYLKSQPIGPLSEEKAIEYLIMKDVPARIWHSKYRYNRQMFKIIKKDQLPKDHTYRDCWRLA